MISKHNGRRCEIDAHGMKVCRSGRHRRPPEQKTCRECRRESDRRSRERNIEKRRAVSRRCAKAWRQRNPERHREATQKWRAAHPERAKEIQRKSQHANRAQQREYMRVYRERNREKVREWDRLWRAKNRERALEKAGAAARARYAKNPDPKKLRASLRRALVASPGSEGVTPKQWAIICDGYRNGDGVVCCAYCGEACSRPTVDHVLPITRGGKDEPSNVVPACKPCNSSKGNRLLGEWRGRLSPLDSASVEHV